jgi:benzoate 4-monooxygenase
LIRRDEWRGNRLLISNLFAFLRNQTNKKGDLAFGERFGMIERGADIAKVEKEGETLYLPAIRILNERGEFSATQGSLPAVLRPYIEYIDPWFSRGAASVQNLTGVH